VAPRDHRESWTVAERVPLGRGWSRQIDLNENLLFYNGSLTPAAYQEWLLGHSVDTVAVPRTAVLDFGSTREGELLRKGPVAGLVQEWSDKDWTVFRVTDARPIAAAPAIVVSSGRTTLVLRSEMPAEVRVDVRWSRWLSLAGPGCVKRDGDRTVVRFTHAGSVTLGSGLLPHGHC
jgi:hypothetical protein